MSSRQQRNSHTYLARRIHVQDNAKKAMECLKSGELTPKLFKEHLRYTAREISQGLRNFEEVIWSLMTSPWVDESDDTTRLRALSSALATVVLPRSASQNKRNQVDAVMRSFLYYNTHRKGSKGSVIDAKSSLADAIKTIRSFVVADAQWADSMGEPNEQAYRAASPLYKLTETEFVNAVCGKLGDVDTEKLWHECEEMRRTMNALVRLLEDYKPIFYTCWECNKVFGNILRCSECKAARYCSTKCQKAAWKGGHKKKCKRTKLMYEFLLENVEEVERAHVTGVQDGFELSPQSDCMAIETCLDYVARGSYSETEGLECSMKNYYENLGRIIRGEWWIFDLSEQEKYAYNAAKAKTRFDIVMVLHMLTLDWFEHTRLMLGTASVDPQQVTEFTDPYFRANCVTPMSASALLEIYHVVEPGMFRPPFKVEAFARLRGVCDELE